MFWVVSLQLIVFKVFEQIYEFEVRNRSIILFSIELYQNNVNLLLTRIRQKDNNLDQKRKYFYRHFGIVRFFSLRLLSVILRLFSRAGTNSWKNEPFRNIDRSTFVFGPGFCPFGEFANIS